MTRAMEVQIFGIESTEAADTNHVDAKIIILTMHIVLSFYLFFLCSFLSFLSVYSRCLFPCAVIHFEVSNGL